jgi:Peptidase family M23
MVLLLAAGATPTRAADERSGVDDPGTTPALIPFTGDRRITATWGPPSGGYHSTPAVDVSLPTGSAVHAAGVGEVVVAKVDGRRCNPREHGGTKPGVAWCLRNGFRDSGTRIHLRHGDRISKYLHLSSIDPAVRKGATVRAGQKIGESGNTGISEAPHLHYEETTLAGKAVDPGAWIGCLDGRQQVVSGLQSLVGTRIRNGGYSCVAPSELTAFVGRWEGMITQTNLSSQFLLRLTFPAGTGAREGTVEIPRSSCRGTVRYRSAANGVYAYAMTWQSGLCLKGTMTLRRVDDLSIAYRWEGEGSGSRTASSGVLRRR